MTSRESRPFLLLALGMSFTAISVTAAFTVRAHADRGLYAMRYAVYEERLAHMNTRWEALKARVDSLETQQADLWRWNRESMNVATTMASRASAQEEFVLAIDQALRGTMASVEELQRRPPWTPPTNTR